MGAESKPASPESSQEEHSEQSTKPQSRMESGIERISSKERRRREQAEHDYRLSLSMHEQIRIALLRRQLEGDADAERLMKDYEILHDEEIQERMPVDESGLGVTERCTVGEGERERIGYLKWQRGERALRMSEGSLVQVQRSFSEGDEMMEADEPVEPILQDALGDHVRFRERQQPRMLEQFEEAYGVQSERFPLSADAYGMRYVDVGHSTRAEVAASTISTLIGYREVPVTALRMDRYELGSLQLRATGGKIHPDAAKKIYDQGKDHPSVPSLTRLAAIDFLIKNSDRHIFNVLYDEEKNEFNGIDNGYTNGYSVPSSEGSSVDRAMNRTPADTYRSIPMEIVDDLELALADEDRKKIQQMVTEVTQYMKYQEGVLSEEAMQSFPEHVRSGQLARSLSDTFRLLHERVDEDGKVLSETTQIAKQELHDFVARALYLVDHGRPPTFDEFTRKRFGLRQKVDQLRQSDMQEARTAEGG